MKKEESFKSRLMRFYFNIHPTYRSTGGKITLMTADWRHTKVRLKLAYRTRNYVGTIYGGSMFSSTDPFYMLMLMKNLGKDYVVWDKAASIKFLKPGKETLYAEFKIDAAEIESIQQEIESNEKTVRDYVVELKDRNGQVIAEITRSIYMASKAYYKNRKNT